MSTATRVPLEIYLRSNYEPDAEYIDGEIRERSVGVLDHADWQQAIAAWFLQNAKTWNVRVFPELRVQVAASNYRVPDVTVLDRSLPTEQIIIRPPIAVFEVLRPGDSRTDLMQKLSDYAKMGIPQIWVADPETASFQRYEAGHLLPAAYFAHGSIQFDLAQIMDFLQA